MTDPLKFVGFVSLFLGGSMFFFTMMSEGDMKKFAAQFIVAPILIGLGLKLIL